MTQVGLALVGSLKEDHRMPSRAIALHHTGQNGAISWLFALSLALAFTLISAMQAPARGAPESFADLAEAISPAVVNITTTTTVAQTDGPRPIVPEGSPLEDFFRDFLDRQDRGDQPQRRGSALGSGFIISDDGFIVTNNHVIEQADEIIIEFFLGGEMKAEVIGTDPKTDIALLKVESKTPLPFVDFGNSDSARVGDWVMAIGNPLGQGFSVSAGIISARNRALRGSYDDYIQTDAAINRGNSGGPLFNMDGDVIGVNTAILSPNGGSIGIGFAMSARVVTGVVEQLKEFGETKRGWLGVRIQDVEDDVAEALGLAAVSGALVTDVPDGPAADAGIAAGDVIVEFDGKEVPDTRSLVRIVGDSPVGKEVDVQIWRDGKMESIVVTLGRLEEATLASATPGDAPAPEPEVAEKTLIGVTISRISEELREEFAIPEKVDGLVVIGIDESSEAFEKGLRVGDVIAEVAQEKVSQPGDVEALLEAARDAGRKSVLFLIQREGQPRFIAVNPAG